ncbi:MAG: hypothetical protein EOM72_04065 [Opitutae bacterium]|nr:hypothetical protein [Opitutae bacterium]
MNIRRLSVVWTSLFAVFWAGCGGSGHGSGLRNKDPGDNDLNVVVAFGDSLTNGSECECPPYPRRLETLIDKVVRNTGVSGGKASDNIGRTQEAIDKYHPAFMLILYGVNDIILSSEISTIVDALDQMVVICEKNNVVPVLATYPEPIEGRALFAPRTLLLNEGIREIAKMHGIKCVDLEREFDADPDLYEPDGLHPNDEGTQIMALAFADLF